MQKQKKKKKKWGMEEGEEVREWGVGVGGEGAKNVEQGLN